MPLKSLVVPAALAALVAAWAGTALATPQSDTTGWQLYRNAQYGFELRYPPDLIIVPSGDNPSPAPLFRVWFQRPSIANSPVGRVAPPEFAVDAYDNASQQNVGTWLQNNQVVNLTRFGQEPVRVGGIEGVRLTGSAQLAPNVFYFVARGPFVYRFTPLGVFGEQMLATVMFAR